MTSDFSAPLNNVLPLHSYEHPETLTLMITNLQIATIPIHLFNRRKIFYEPRECADALKTLKQIFLNFKC